MQKLFYTSWIAMKRFIVVLGVCFIFVYVIWEEPFQRQGNAAEPTEGVDLNVPLKPENVSILAVPPRQFLEKEIILPPRNEEKSPSAAVRANDVIKTSSSVISKKLKRKKKIKFGTSSSVNPTKKMLLNALEMNVLQEIYGMKYSEIVEAYIRNDALRPLTPQKLLKKKQIIVATTWRSGSTFMYDLLRSHLGTYTIYEPLMTYRMETVYDKNSLILSDGINGQKLIHDLLTCKYDSKYLSKLIGKKFVFRGQNHLLAFCKGESLSISPLCFENSFLEAACSIYPWIIMKVVRFGLQILKPILEDESLNPYVIHLVRDPRAVMHSRISTVTWCKGVCLDVVSLCNHMEDNLKYFNEFSTLYPGRVHLIRYEDISLSPLNVTKGLFKNIEFDFNPRVEAFIDTHTREKGFSPHSTTRESSKQVLKWTSQIDSATLDRVQKTCTKVMEQMGYLPITSTNNLTIDDVLGPLNL